MNPTILLRIKELKQRLTHLRRQQNDATTRIAIEAIEQELARTAARLPREWDLVQDHEGAALTLGVRADSQWWL